ncbi:hypothetical protein DYBT9275_04651 [Dyadobacter sp. CECT 9275]|uniref:Uncharacterized protein n=1 Tax=Dyadobacter helix TaxID=2822344 RepID=A0A916JGD2_9BACT|nr:hypothetical protein [Dyadobacter sp. CECT 9275]CAG5010134.1 hypothetical protein DYBT9275_04651 [Dyadobacter sp. CECT 9275]
MKRYALFLLFAIVSCKKEANPDLANGFVGNYYFKEKTPLSVIETIWKISRIDNNHVKIAIEENTDYADTTPDEQEVMTMNNVFVEFQNALIFNSEYELNGNKGLLTGTALLLGDTLSYDIIATEKDVSLAISKVVVRR